MIDNLKEISSVAWGDMRFLRHSALSVLVMSLMSPLLYLLAFGYGLGNGQIIDGVSYIAFIIPGIVALTALSASFSSTSARMNVQRLYYHNFDELILCPLRYSSIAIGKAMLGVVRGLISCAIIFIIGLFLAPELHFTIEFLITLVVSCFTFSLLGESAALIAKSHQSMSTFSTLVILPMTFLCGTFFSVSSMPEWFQAILYCLPLTYSSTLMRESSLGLDYSWLFLIVLIAFGVALLLFNIYLMRERKI
ncbi:MAG: ABC transporter permease [Candidatus Methanogranum gryphiswaldense]|nr:MAG: ABC transporter permease [Candidatus Methanogranum sp. U3.2.1]